MIVLEMTKLSDKWKVNLIFLGNVRGYAGFALLHVFVHIRLQTKHESLYLSSRKFFVILFQKCQNCAICMI